MVGFIIRAYITVDVIKRGKIHEEYREQGIRGIKGR